MNELEKLKQAILLHPEDQRSLIIHFHGSPRVNTLLMAIRDYRTDIVVRMIDLAQEQLESEVIQTLADIMDNPTMINCIFDAFDGAMYSYRGKAASGNPVVQRNQELELREMSPSTKIRWVF